MKKSVKSMLALIIAGIMMLTSVSVSFADNYMAYNFYSDPDLSGTSRSFDTFMIDFRGTITPNNTYWSLCNFGMYLGSAGTTSLYPSIRGYGAYCGLQNRQVSQGKAGILSFWEATYKAEGAVYDSTQGAYMLNGEKVLLRASRVYPEGSSTFTGEGDGTNCIAAYPWETGKWYTMLLHSWTDAETGTTFVGEWFKNVQTGEWTLFSYFDTHLYDSYLIGGMSQFQENYWQYGEYNYVAERACNLKNMYAYDHARHTWQSLNKSTLSYGDGGGNNKAGAHSFGKSSDEDGEFWWASTGGVVEDQAAYEAAATKRATYTISQPASPVMGQTKIYNVSLINSNGGKSVYWTLSSNSAPQIGYTVNVYDYFGNLLLTKHGTRPEVRSVDISEVEEEAIRYEVVIDNVFGGTAVKQNATAAYNNPRTVSIGSASASTGDVFDLAVNVAGNSGFNGFEIDVGYDPEALEFLSGSVDIPGTGSVTGGNGTLTLKLDGADYSSNGTIATLSFRALKPGSTLIQPSVSEEKCFYVLSNGVKKSLPTAAEGRTIRTLINEDEDFCYILSTHIVRANSESMKVRVEMKNPPADIYGFSIEILFDADKLEFVKGTFDPAFPYGRAFCSEPGVVRAFSATKLDSPATGNSRMVDLTFNLIDEQRAMGDEYDFSINFYNSEPAYTRVDGATVKYTDIGTNELNVVLLSAEDPFDVDESGKADINDVSFLLDHLSLNGGFLSKLDLNASGAVDIADVTALLDYLSDLEF